MSMESVNLMCHAIIAISTVFIAIHLDTIQENIKLIKRSLNFINDELEHQHFIREIVMKLDRIANILDTLYKEDGDNE